MIKQIVAGLGVLTLAASANASLITNGDFEDGLNGWGYTNTLWGPGVSVEEEVLTDGSVNHYALLDDPDSVGYEGLAQTFTVADGVDSITVAFDYKFNEVDTSVLLSDIAWAKILKTDSGHFVDFDVLGSVTSDTGDDWVSFVGTVDTSSLWATSPNAVISFNIVEVWAGLFIDRTDSSLFIDNVSIVDTYASVPEPSALMLLGLGLAGFGLSRKRKA